MTSVVEIQLIFPYLLFNAYKHSFASKTICLSQILVDINDLSVISNILVALYFPADI